MNDNSPNSAFNQSEAPLIMPTADDQQLPENEFLPPFNPKITVSHKWPKIVALVVGVLLIVALICVVLFKAIGSPDYGTSYQLVKELGTEFTDMWGDLDASCSAMLSQESDPNVATTEYHQYITECRQTLAQAWDTTYQLGKSSGITKDSELKQQFETFQNSMNSAFPPKQDLTKMEKTITAVHDFAVRLGTIDGKSNANDVKTAAAVLIDSGSTDWAEFGKTWQTKMLKLLDARQAYATASYSDPQYQSIQQNYYDALDDLNTYLSEIDYEGWDNGGFHFDAIDQLETNFDALSSAVRTAYEEHYDGKNTANCVELDAGKASCD